MTRSTGRPVRTVRAWRLVIALTIIPNIYFGIVNALAGQGVAFASFAAVLFVLGAVTFQTAAIKRMEAKTGQHYPLAEPVLRRIAHRPRRIMTPDDYKRLREMETELGWEPSKVPESLAASGVVALEPRKPSAACDCCEDSLAVDVRAFGSAAPVARYCAECGRQRKRHEAAPSKALTARAKVSYGGTTALSGSGSLSAKARHAGGKRFTSSSGRCICPECQQAIRESLREARGKAAAAAGHFEALARVGLEFCPSYCPICAERLDTRMRSVILAPKPDLGVPAGDLGRDMQDLRDLDQNCARAFTPDDIALMRSGAIFGTDATVTLPSGKRMTGTEISQWIKQDQLRRWLEVERWGGNES